MSVASITASMVSTRPRVRGMPVASKHFTWGFVALAIGLVAGAYLDTFAHHNIPAVNKEGFVTPWHVLLYSMLFLLLGYLSLTLFRNVRRGHVWHEALPSGYGLSWLAMVAFGVGGGLDFLWHRLFGIELSVAALMSPTHLLLMLSGGLIVSGPLRSAADSRARYAPWPAVISAALILSMLTFFAQFDNPYVDVWAQGASPSPRLPAWAEEELGMLGILLQATMLSGVALLLMRRFQLRFGSLTLLVGLNGLFVASIEDHPLMFAAALLGGLAADTVYAAVRPVVADRVAFRAFAFALPACVAAAYFLVLAIEFGVWWPIHFWAGAVPLAGGTGWLLSFIALPARTEGLNLTER
jgi:hypothetical protein